MGNQRIHRTSTLTPSGREKGSRSSPPASSTQPGKDDFRAQSLERASRLGHRVETVRRQFIVGGVAKDAAGVSAWIADNVPANRPDVAAVVRKWASTPGTTTNHATDLAAYQEAVVAAGRSVAYENDAVAANISARAPGSVAWNDYEVWAEWYFSGLEYQNNKTNGWHQNRAGLLPGAATEEGVPTRYVEFRRPGAVGVAERTKMERCIFDLLTGNCWPNAHYDGGYVQVTGVPAGVKNALFTTAYAATGLLDRAKAMTPAERLEAGVGLAKVQWLLNKLAAEHENT